MKKLAFNKDAMPGNYTYTNTSICAPCLEKKARELWGTICPPLFRDTDINRLPDQRATALALAWKFGPAGLLLVGKTRTGKSRTAWEVLRRNIFQGKVADRIDGKRMADLILGYGRDSYSSGILNKWCQVSILLMDDVFKIKLTDRVEEQLFIIIDERMQQKLPVIVTTNDTEETLFSRLSPDRGVALIERLKECCHAINFTNES